ncbi:AbrB family transcriptional regulator [Gracilibacillus oryzae]|uniref:AbrB family transcriptional regulator n=1 Tax=Gracilibacillus oryzae TaxID=1672701 RepID=A0A7C8GW21_9BACI|nr:AbrB family transcriptional regulator [Gracilibacillus oryzae]KAB8138546.1 AbrB family transcriptional regulator [Gracilibacillus oryzae]
MKSKIIPYIKMYGVAILITVVFVLLHVPLPWILGPIVGIFILKKFSKDNYILNKEIRNVSFAITGVQIGATFTTATIGQVAPYFLPFLLFTVVLIILSIVSGIFFAKIAKMGQTTGVIGSVPGGLSVMVAISDSMKANTGLVAIFHTIRLISVLFIVPIVATLLFKESGSSEFAQQTVDNDSPLWTILIYGIIYFIAYLLRFKIPASYVLVPMIIIAIIKIIGLPIIPLASFLFHFAQLSIGIHLGLSIELKDIKKAGRYTFLYFFLTIVIISLSVLFGYMFAELSDLTFATGMLSMAPGGLVEMAITAHDIGADPAIVGSLQLVRMLIIILLLPIVLTKVWGRQ